MSARDAGPDGPTFVQRTAWWPTGARFIDEPYPCIRDDKAPGQVTALGELRALYERQFTVKGRAV